MPAIRLIHSIRPAKVILVLALCAAVAASAVADHGGDRSRGPGSPGRGSDSRPSVGGRSGQDHGSDRSPGRSESPRGGTISQPARPGGSDPGRRDQGNSSGRPSVNHRTSDTNKPTDQSRPSERPSTVYTRPGESQRNHDFQERRPDIGSRPAPVIRDDRRPDTGSRPAPVIRDDRRSDRQQVSPRVREIERAREIERVREIDRYRPRDYAPPVHRGGFFYYSSRPHYKPMHYGHWVFGNYDPLFCRKSVYFHYGYFPYVQVVRVHIGPYVTLSYYSTPVVIREGYYLDRRTTSELDYALSDIRSAWLDGRSDLIASHVRTGQQIAVLLDGHYDYSIEPDDYVQMTGDAIDQMQTISFTWQSVRQRTDGAYTAFGKHTYRDSEETVKTVYVSYALRWIGGSYFIEEVGSSLSPLN